MGMAAQQTPDYLAHAGIEQRLGQPLPMTAVFTDETGRSGPLSSWFSDKPVVMAEVYYQCAMMCPQVQHGLATGLAQTTLKPGQDYQVLVVSIDTMDKPANAVEREEDIPERGRVDEQSDGCRTPCTSLPRISRASTPSRTLRGFTTCACRGRTARWTSSRTRA